MSSASISSLFDYKQSARTSTDPYPDPLGYACAAESTPPRAGAVLCRRIEEGRTWDANGLVVVKKYGTYFSYDARGRLKKAVGPIEIGASPTVRDPLEERSYWPEGQSGPNRGRLSEIRSYPTSARSLVTSLEYDLFGLYRATLKNGAADPSSRSWTMLKDGMGRVRSWIGPDNSTYEIRYHDGSAPRLVIAPSLAAIRFVRDEKARVEYVDLLAGDPDANPSLPVVWRRWAEYDAAGNPVSVELRDAVGVQFRRTATYDSDHRIVSRDHPHLLDGQQPPQPVKARWAYDAAGFLSSFTDEEGRITELTPDLLGDFPSAVRRKWPSAPGAPDLLMAEYTLHGGRLQA